MDKEKTSLGSPSPSTDGQLTQVGYDERVTAKSMYPHINESALLTKIDLRVVPVLSLVFVFAFLDRINIANAAVYGMGKELGLVGNQYNAALTIFFVPYILFEVPGNLLLKRFRPRLWLPGCVFLFGCITIAQGFVKNLSGLLATRFFLGLIEAWVSPGCYYIIAMWYTRTEVQKRFTAFFGSTSLAGAFGGLLAYGISKLNGTAGLTSWRWVFVIEGLMTVGCAILVYFLAADFPEDAKWLSEEERAFVKARLAEDVGDPQLDAKPTWRDVLGVFKDFKIFLGGFMYFGLVVSGYGYALFAPTIIRSFGYSPVRTQLLSVPPWAATFTLSMIVAAASDYYKRRYIFILPMMLVSVVGVVVLLHIHNNVKVMYGALFLVVMGQFSAGPIVSCWFTSNLSGHLRRGVGVAFQVGFGNSGAIISTFSYLAKDAPRFVKGYSLSLGFIGLSAISCTLYFFALISENRKRAKGLSEHSGKSPEEKARLGDLNPDYRYML